MIRRVRPSIEPSDPGGEVIMTPAAYLKEVLADPSQYVDSGNAPLPEDQENRIAWMGVELQPLNRELARANNVAHLTNDGETGAIVSHVYPDSPAAQAGIEAGDVLLRLSVKGLPKPLEVVLQPDQFEGDNFSWDDLDDVPDQYADQLPTPWPAAENPLTRVLTDLGLGKSYQAEFSRGGQAIIKDFQIVQSPPHFDSAARYKSEALGLTVRDLTYEVRRYFQKKPDDLGVIVSRVEPGSKASVAGIKPFEIITLVNEKPVPTVKDFEKLIANQNDLRLSVNRMTANRLVKIDMTAPVEETRSDQKAAPGGVKPLRESKVRP
jgi:serine protease Do